MKVKKFVKSFYVLLVGFKFISFMDLFVNLLTC